MTNDLEESGNTEEKRNIISNSLNSECEDLCRAIFTDGSNIV